MKVTAADDSPAAAELRDALLRAGGREVRGWLAAVEEAAAVVLLGEGDRGQAEQGKEGTVPLDNPWP